MRMMMIDSFPIEPLTATVRDGSAGAKMQKILAAQKRKAAYFTDMDGKATAILIVELAKGVRPFRRWRSHGFSPSNARPGSPSGDGRRRTWGRLVGRSWARNGLDSFWRP